MLQFLINSLAKETQYNTKDDEHEGHAHQNTNHGRIRVSCGSRWLILHCKYEPQK